MKFQWVSERLKTEIVQRNYSKQTFYSYDSSLKLLLLSRNTRTFIQDELCFLRFIDASGFVESCSLIRA